VGSEWAEVGFGGGGEVRRGGSRRGGEVERWRGARGKEEKRTGESKRGRNNK